MATSNDYSLGYEAIDTSIASINSKADELDQKLDRIDTIASMVEEIWKGSDAEQYIAEMNAFKPQIKQLASTYKTTMISLQSQVNIMKESQAANTASINSELSA